jgi:hypothetical protein
MEVRMSLKDLADVLSALLTPLIALLAAYIAWQQYRVQHRSYNGQMYERRRVVFGAFMAFLSGIMRDGRTGYDSLGKFNADASEADFLFSEKVVKKRDELYDRALEMISGYERMYPQDGSPGLPVGPERSKLAQEHADHLKWFFKQISLVRDLFKVEMRV